MKKNIRLIFSAFILLTFITSTTFGQDTIRSIAADTIKSISKKPFAPKFYLYAGVFKANVSTTFLLDGQRGPQFLISLEDDLNFSDNATVASVDGLIKFKKRSSLYMSWYTINRKNEWIADHDITILDSTYHIGADLMLSFKTMFLSASYRYAIFSNPNVNAGLSAGLRYSQITTSIELHTANSTNSSESLYIYAPVPVIGVFIDTYLSKRFEARYNFDYFALNFEGVKMNVFNNKLDVEYFFIKNLGIGTAINFVNYSINEIPLGERFSGDMRYSLHGFSLFLTARF